MKIVCLGAGNVAFHLVPHLHENGHEILQVGSRSLKTARKLARKVDAQPINSMSLVSSEADIYLMMVSDDSIKQLSDKMPFALSKKQIICHCSGSIDSLVLKKHPNYGVLYPLQSFSKNVKLDYKEIPFFVTSNNLSTKRKLLKLARLFTAKVKSVSDAERSDLHIAAVIVNNFVNYLLGAAADISKKQEIDFKHLHPLIKETINKALNNDPNLVQTGPAKRKDKRVIKDHLKKLKSSPELAKVYSSISKAIEKKYN